MDVLKHVQENYILTGDEYPKILQNTGRRKLYTLFSELGFKLGCEVGVQRGRNAGVLLDQISGLKLYLVDSYTNHPFSSRIWEREQFKKFKRIAHNRLKGKNVEWLEMFSEQAVSHIRDESLDFVYIDADHSYKFAMVDIILWERKVRPGGIISGHDYFKNDRKGRLPKVTAAVNHFTTIHRIKPWFITDRYFEEKESGDTYSSWFWVKKGQ